MFSRIDVVPQMGRERIVKTPNYLQAEKMVKMKLAA
jgi:hypothetical protein